MGLNKEDSHIQENDNFVKWLGLVYTHTHNTKTENGKRKKEEAEYLLILNKAETVNNHKQNFFLSRSVSSREVICFCLKLLLNCRRGLFVVI